MFFIVACFFESFEEHVFHESVAVGWTGFQFHGIVKVDFLCLFVLDMTKGKKLGSGLMRDLFVKNLHFFLNKFPRVHHTCVLSQSASTSRQALLRSLCSFEAETFISISSSCIFVADDGKL